MKKMRDIESSLLQNLELDSKKIRNVRNVIFKDKNYEIRNFLGFDSKESIESKNVDSIKMASIESRFYRSIKNDNLDSIKLGNIKSNILNYKGFSPCESALDSMSHPYPPIENLSQIHRAKIQVQQDSKKTKKRIYANTQSGRKDSNVFSETIIVTESSLKDSKNIESNLQNLDITEYITINQNSSIESNQLDSINSLIDIESNLQDSNLNAAHHPVFDKDSNLNAAHRPVFDKDSNPIFSTESNQKDSIESNTKDSINSLQNLIDNTTNKNTQIDYVESIPLDEYKPKESHNKSLLEVKNIEISFKDFAKKSSIFDIFKRKKHKNNAIESRDENHAINIESKKIESNNKTKESKDSNENIESNTKTNAQNIESNSTNTARNIESKNKTNAINIESKNKNTKQILKNINFDIKEHEFVSVIGDSGCGKSTLLKILAGFLKPNKGEILFQGQKHNKPNADISVMFQTPTLYPWLTLSKNIAFSAKLKHKSAKEQQEIAQKYIKMVGLKEQEKSYPYQCSGGMQSRAYLAQVLACESKLILMDEPFAALDAFTKRSMQDLVLLLYKRLKSSVFFITHDIEEALYLSNRIFIMKPLSNSIESNIVEILNIDMDRQNRDEFERSKEFLQLKEYLYARVKERYDYVI